MRRVRKGVPKHQPIIQQNRLTLTVEEENIIKAQLSFNLKTELNSQEIAKYPGLFKKIATSYDIHDFLEDLYYSEIGDILLQEGKKENYAPALYAYTTSLRLNQNYIDSYIGIGKIFECHGENDKALAFFNKAITFQYNYSTIKHQDKEITNDNYINVATKSIANAYYYKALLLNKTEKPNEALTNLQEAIEFNPCFINAYLQKAFIFENSGDFKQVIESYDKVIKYTYYSNRDISISAFYQKARVYAKTGDLVNSIQSCDIFIQEKLKYEHNIKYVKAYISLHPNDPLASNSKYDPPLVQTSYSEAYSLKQNLLSSTNPKESYYYGALAAFYSEDYGNTIKLFDLAEEYINGMSYSFRILCACMKGQSYSAIDDETKALAYFKKASELAEEVNKKANINNFKEAYAIELKNLSGAKKDLINKLKDLQEQIIEACTLPESEFTNNYIQERYDLNSSIIENFATQIMLNTDNNNINDILTNQITVLEAKVLPDQIKEALMAVDEKIFEEISLVGLNEKFKDLDIVDVNINDMDSISKYFIG